MDARSGPEVRAPGNERNNHRKSARSRAGRAAKLGTSDDLIPALPGRSLAHRRRCRRHLHRHGAARRPGRRAHLQVAVRAGRSQRGRLGRAAAGRPAARPAALRPAARLRAVRARLDRGHQHHPREEGRQGRPAHHRGLPRFAGDPPRHPREPVGPPRAVPRGAGAALPAPAGARTHRRRRPRAGAAGRRGRRRGGQGVRRRRRRIRRRLPVQFLPRRHATSARPARGSPRVGRANGSRCRARSCRPWASTSAARPPWSTPTSRPR